MGEREGRREDITESVEQTFFHNRENFEIIQKIQQCIELKSFLLLAWRDE